MPADHVAAVEANGTGAPADEATGSMWLTELSVRRPLLMLMAILSVMIFGLIAYSRLGVDLFPSVEFPVVSVTVPYPGASPEVVEALVARPVEDAVSGLADLDSVSSTSSEGVAIVVITFKDKADPKTVAIDVEKRVNAIRGALPNDILAPTILKFDFTAAPIMNLGLSGENVSAAQAFRIADEVVRPKLEVTNGVGQVTVFGGQQREIQVKVDPARLRAYGLSLAQVSQALGSENVDAPGGRIDDGTRTMNLRVDARFRSVDEIGETVVVAPPTGGSVRVRDLATVEDAFKDQTFLARVDGRPGVGISVSKQSSSNVTQTAANVRETVARLGPLLPEGVTLKVITDSSNFITQSLEGVQRTLLEANVLTGLVLLAFLHSWRSTVIVLLAIPTSLIATFAFMYWQGFTFNFLTTLALTLTIGILVDDSIVVLENIFRFLQRGHGPRAAALRGRAEIGLAAIAITLVDVVVFAPVGLLSGQVGQFFRQFGFTVVFATLSSLAVSFTLTPMLASRWLRAEDEHGTGWLAAFGRAFDGAFRRLERGYARVLRWSLGHRWRVIAVAFACLVAAGAMPATGVVKSSFFPSQDQGLFSIILELPPGSTLDATAAAVASLEAKVLERPEVKATYAVVGQGDSALSRQARFANVTVVLVPARERAKPVEVIAQEAKALAQGIPGLKVRAGVPGPGGQGGQVVSFRLFGDDLRVLNGLAEEVVARLRAAGPFIDVTNSGQAGSPEQVVTVDRARAADLGLAAGSVAQAVRTAYAGTVATSLRREQASGSASGIDVRVQLGDEARKDATLLAQVPLLSPARGGLVSLGQVATIAPRDGPSQVQRTDRQRAVTIGANVLPGVVLSDATAQVDAIIAGVALPEGYRIKMGGQSESQASTFREFGGALALSIGLVYIVLVALYESLLYPLIVILALPLALFGAMSGLAIGRETLNIFSLIGVIALVGLVGKNSILVIDFTNHLRRERGMSRLDALMEAGPLRLRPILMTSATLISAQVPLMLKLEAGSEIQAPIGWVIFGGMITSTVLALLFVPTMYTVIDDVQEWVLRRWRGAGAARGATTPTPSPTPVATGEGSRALAIPATPNAPTPSPSPVAAGEGSQARTTPTTTENGMTGSDMGGKAPAPRGTAPAGVARLAMLALAVGVAGLGLVACGGTEGPAGTATAAAKPTAPPLNVVVADARQETLRATVSGSGAVEAVDQAAASAKVSGRVTRLDAEVGQKVRAGQFVAELERATIEAQVAQAEAGLVVAQARLGTLERGPREDDLAVAAAQRVAAEKQAEAVAAQADVAAQSITTFDAQIEASRASAAASAAVARAAATSAQASQAQARAARANASAAATRLQAIRNPRAEDLALLDGQVESARIRLEQASRREDEQRVLEAQLEGAQVALAQALDPARPEQARAAQVNLDVAKATLANLVEAPVRAEDLEVARLAWEASDKAFEAAGESSRVAEKAWEAAKRSRSQLGPLVVSDSALAQAESGLVGAQANVEQSRIRRDQAREAYDKARGGPTGWDLRKVQLAVEAAQAQLDLTRNADPARVQAARLQVEQAQLNVAMRKRQVAWDLQAARVAVDAAENSRAKVVNPGEFDVASLAEAANAAEAQAQAAEASATAAASQAEGSANQASAASAQVAALESQRAGTRSQVVAARSQAEGARASAEQAAAAYRLRANPYTEDDLKSARATVAQAEAAVALARASLAETTIVAPIDGTVAARHVSSGSLVNPGQAVVTVISHAVEVTVPVEEARVGSVKEGQAVAITSPALPGATIAGRVSAMTPGGDARNRSFTARIRPADAAGALRPGMFVQATIATEERAAATVIARDAVVASGGASRVFVLGADNRVQARTVRLGIVAGSVVEVLEGVKPGEKVVVTATDDLRDGVAVNPSAR